MTPLEELKFTWHWIKQAIKDFFNPKPPFGHA